MATLARALRGCSHEELIGVFSAELAPLDPTERAEFLWLVHRVIRDCGGRAKPPSAPKGFQHRVKAPKNRNWTRKSSPKKRRRAGYYGGTIELTLFTEPARKSVIDRRLTRFKVTLIDCSGISITLHVELPDPMAAPESPRFGAELMHIGLLGYDLLHEAGQKLVDKRSKLLRREIRKELKAAKRDRHGVAKLIVKPERGPRTIQDEFDPLWFWSKVNLEDYRPIFTDQRKTGTFS